VVVELHLFVTIIISLAVITARLLVVAVGDILAAVYGTLDWLVVILMTVVKNLVQIVTEVMTVVLVSGE
tara:strand:- start:3 stop:209 length:207 start_codon:yes stop_codon:yes gene_type:complete